MPYFDESVGRVKIQATSKNSQRYYTTKGLIRDLLSKLLCPFGRISWIFIMRDRSMRSGTELAWEIQLTDWSTAGEQVKPVQPVLCVIFVLVLGVICTLPSAVG